MTKKSLFLASTDRLSTKKAFLRRSRIVCRRKKGFSIDHGSFIGKKTLFGAPTEHLSPEKPFSRRPRIVCRQKKPFSADIG